MSKKREPFSWRERVWFQIRQGWVAFVGVGIVFAAIAALAYPGLRFENADGEPTDARITAIYFGTAGRNYPGPGMIVRAESRDGLTGSISVPPDRVRGCKIGDPVLAERVGNRLRLEPWPCQH